MRKIMLLLIMFSLLFSPVLAQNHTGAPDPNDPGCTDSSGDNCYLEVIQIFVPFPNSAPLQLLVAFIVLFVVVRVIIRLWDLVGF